MALARLSFALRLLPDDLFAHVLGFCDLNLVLDMRRCNRALDRLVTSVLPQLVVSVKVKQENVDRVLARVATMRGCRITLACRIQSLPANTVELTELCAQPDIKHLDHLPLEKVTLCRVPESLPAGLVSGNFHNVFLQDHARLMKLIPALTRLKELSVTCDMYVCGADVSLFQCDFFYRPLSMTQRGAHFTHLKQLRLESYRGYVHLGETVFLAAKTVHLDVSDPDPLTIRSATVTHLHLNLNAFPQVAVFTPALTSVTIETVTNAVYLEFERFCKIVAAFPVLSEFRIVGAQFGHLALQQLQVFQPHLTGSVLPPEWAECPSELGHRFLLRPNPTPHNPPDGVDLL